MSSPKILEPDKTKERLKSKGIINNSKDYLNQPVDLQFPMDLPDGRSCLLLLQAALSETLCQIFLEDAYFLVEGIETSKTPNSDSANKRRQLKELEESYETYKEIGVDWRIQTAKLLEHAVPPDAVKGLTQHFVNFFDMTLEFWKTRTVIKAYGLSNFEGEKFEADSSRIEAEGSLQRETKKRLEGRHFGVVTRPLIISEPLRQEGEGPRKVIWLKAVGWVSDSKGSVEPPDKAILLTTRLR
ncbi:hypothetical protein TrVFT333_009222 [Trichoderma virens FT-333]|nr:hypothetical protein TrVFT333_009222 [Trichoderma virens FT-333]